MTLYRIQIEPRAPFFLGLGSHARKAGVLVHSDTLHAALVSVAARTGSPLLEHAQQLRVSSMYPYWKSIYFYPKPFLPVPREESAKDDPKAGKRWKSIRLISEGMLTAWLAGDTALSDNTEALDDGLAALKTECANLPRPLHGFLDRGLAPAVTVDRCGAGATPFDRRGLRVNTDEGVGAWFLAELDEAQVVSFHDVVDLLGTNGLGGERTVGYGQFDILGIEPCPPDGVFAPCPQADAVMALSLYHPTRDEAEAGVLDGIAAYDATVRGGWLDAATTQGGRPRRALRMCLEGSVFPKTGNGPLGDVRDVRPEGFGAHPVWRSGLLTGLPFKYVAPAKRRVAA